MKKKDKIAVHRIDWQSGIYLKSFDAVPSGGPVYELSQAQRHDFYYCVLLESGEMEAEVDFETFKLKGKTLFFTYPGQVHRIISADLRRGWFLAFAPSIIPEQLRNILDQGLAGVMLVDLEANQSEPLSETLALLHKTSVKYHNQPSS